MPLLFQNPAVIDGIVYMASDFHFGSPDEKTSKWREKRVIEWLDRISSDATHLFLLGDIFDFWFEYKDVVPRGYFRFFSKLHQLTEQKIKIYYFTGNHDMWVKNYFTRELGFEIYRAQQPFFINGKRCLVGHGDGLGPRDRGYKFIKWLFACRPNIKLYGSLHPRHAYGLARFLSSKSRSMTSAEEEKYMGDEREMLVQYALNVLKTEKIDYFIYGHRHLPLEKELPGGSFYVNTGDWLIHDTYIRFDSQNLRLCKFDPSGRI